MVLSKNYFNQLEIPQFILCKASKERLGIIQAVEKTYDRKFNDLDEISFTLYLDPLEHYKNTDQEKYYADNFDRAFYNSIYNAIDVMKYIEVPSVGRFAITNVQLSSEGAKNENKQVTAPSYECLLGQKYLENFTFNKGTVGSVEYQENVALEQAYPFYTDGQTGNDLWYFVLEKFPEWHMGHIDESLKGMIRSFEVDSKDVYSFIMEDVASAYKCYFVFDTLSLTINAYALEDQSKHDARFDTNVHVSYNNLLKSTNITCDIDSIKTCLTVQGDSDDVVVREINMGQDKIYNFDYYANTDYMSQNLIDDYNKWKAARVAPVDTSKISYKNGVLSANDISGLSNIDAYSKLLEMEYELYLQRAEENDSKMPYESNQRYIGYGTFMTNYSYKTTDVVTAYVIPGNPIYSRTWLTASKNSKIALSPKIHTAYAVYDDNTNSTTGYYWDNTVNAYKRLDTVHFDAYTSAQMVSSLPSSGDGKILYIIGSLNGTTLRPSSNYAMYRWDSSTSRFYNVNLWDGYALVPYQEKLKVAQRQMSVASKAGYGNPSPKTVTTGSSSVTLNAQTALNLYLTQYVPAYYTVQVLQQKVNAQTAVVQNIDSNIAVINRAESVIANYVDIDRWLTKAELTELSAFIREDTLSTEYFTLTDSMTQSQRSEMLHALLDYANEELQRVSMPELTFTADMVDLFRMPEFDPITKDNANGIAKGFDIGTYIWITLRDDLTVQAKVTQIHFDFYNPDSFSVTFSNITKKKADLYTDLQDAINEASSAATSVTFNQANWNEMADQAANVHRALQDGLLSQGYYLRNASNSEMVIDDRGIFVDTLPTTDSSSSMYGHGRGDANGYDSIYIGGGRILFTSDGWSTVSMSVGRGDVAIPDQSKLKNGEMAFNTESRFGVFADYVIAGYLAGSTIVGGQLYSDNFRKNVKGSHLNLEGGTFEFYSSKTSGNNPEGNVATYMTLDDSGNLNISGNIKAYSGSIGKFTIGSGIYSPTRKNAINANANGIYLGTEGLSIGNVHLNENNRYSWGDGVYFTSSGTAVISGEIQAEKGKIGGFYIDSSSIHSPENKNLTGSPSGVYIGTSGIGVGNVRTTSDGRYYSGSGVYLSSNGTAILSGEIQAAKGQIGGFTITSSSIYNNKPGLHSYTTPGVYVGTDGIAVGLKGSSNEGTKGFFVSSAGEVYASQVNIQGNIYADSGRIAGFTIASGKDSEGNADGTGKIYKGRSSLNSGNGVYVGTDGISVGTISISSNNKAYSSGKGIYLGSDGTAIISGDIQAQSGTIGSGNTKLILDSSGAIRYGKSNINDGTTGFYLGTTGFAVGTLDGIYNQETDSYGGRGIRADSQGNFRVQGTIVASAGRIGNTYIRQNELQGGTIRGANFYQTSGTISANDFMKGVALNKVEAKIENGTVTAGQFEIPGYLTMYADDTDDWSSTKGMALDGHISVHGAIYTCETRPRAADAGLRCQGDITATGMIAGYGNIYANYTNRGGGDIVATQKWVNDQGFTTGKIPDVSDFVTTDECARMINTAIANAMNN